jgi:hypothetical protein
MRRLRLALLLAAMEAGCRGTRDRPSPAAPVAARPIAVGSAARRIWLGRLVDPEGWKVVRTLTEPPDEEITDVDGDVGVVRLKDMRIAAFRLSTGELVWQRVPFAPCRKLLLAGSKIYAGCGDQVVSYAVQSGEAKVVDAGPGAKTPLLAGPFLVSPHEGGRVELYDSRTDKLRASQVLPELARAFHQYILANPVSDGVCALGLVVLSANRLTYRAGCYDDRFRPQWTKALPMTLPHDPVYDVRQLGPRFLVLDNQYSVLDPSIKGGTPRGLLLRWRDGEVTQVHDQTPATFETPRGDRLIPDSDVFGKTRSLVVEHEEIPLRQAQVDGDDRRTFALIANGATGLAGIDRATGRTLFLVPVALGGLWKLEMADGLPVVRTQFVDRWEITVFDPTTGRVVYRDARPLARGH